MREYYRNIIFKVLMAIAIIIVIAIEWTYISSLHGFYSLIVILGFVYVWEKITTIL